MIQKLKDEVADQICSQQIITSLNQCIKQLIDNSIDAKATTINIRLTDFGKRTIQIYDNGVGIKNVELLGKKGTTSKTSVNANQQILNNIKSLGFRGEALTSISKLSKEMTIDTTYKVNDHFQYKSYNMKTMKLIQHKILDPSTNPFSNTNIVIEEIFDCLPIRREQLKQRTKQNLRQVFNTMNQICLVYPEIKFVLCNDTITSGLDLLIQQQKYQVFDQKSWRKRIQDCFPGKLQDALVYITHQNIQGFVLNTIDSGSSRKNLKFSKNMSYMYLNRRPITPIKKIHKIFDQIYKKYNPYTKYVYFLNLKLPPSCVDINLTPNKRQVFIKLQFMQKVIQQVVSQITKKIIQKIGNLEDFKEKKNFSQQLQPVSQKKTKPNSIKKVQEDDVCQDKSISKKSLQNIRIELKKGNKNTQEVYDNSQKTQINSNLAQRLKQKMSQGLEINNLNKIKQEKKQLNSKNNLSNNQFIKELKNNLQKKNNQSQQYNQNKGLHQNYIQKKIQLKNQKQSQEFLKKKQKVQQTHEEKDIFSEKKVKISNFIEEKKQKYIVSNIPKINQLNQNYKREYIEKNYRQNQQEKQEKQIQLIQHSNWNQYNQNKSQEQKNCKKSQEQKNCNNSLQRSLQKINLSNCEEHQNNLLNKTKKQLKEQKISTLQQLYPLKLLTNQSQINFKLRPSNKQQVNNFQEIKIQKQKQLQHSSINYINQNSAISKQNFKQFYIHGQFNHGFILSSFNKKLFLIDQHAASEKDNFQRLMDTKFGFICQIQIKKINPMEADHIQMADKILKQSGFTYQIQNRAQLKITKCPTFLKQIFNGEHFMEIVQNNKPLRQLPVFYNSAASRACRAAIMIGDRLNKQEMQNILNKMSQLKSPWNCPHGRPSLIELGNINEKAKKIKMARKYQFDQI